MKFNVEQSELLKVLTLCNNVTKKTVSEILKCVKIEKVSDTRLRFNSTNYDTTIRYDIDAENVEGDSVIYDISSLLAIVSKLSGTICFNDNVITKGKSKFKISEIRDEYPLMQYETDKEGIIVNSNLFDEYVSRVKFATSDDNGILSGVYFNGDEIVACNGVMLALTKIDADIDLGSYVFPKSELSYIKGLFNGLVKIAVEANRIFISDENILITFCHLMGNYPNYKQLLPKYDDYFVVDKKELLSALDMISVTCDKLSKIVYLKVSDNKLVLCGNGDILSGTTEIECDNTFDIDFALNIDYLLDIIKVVEYEQIKIYGCSDPLKPFIIEAADNSFTLITPMQK